MHIAMINLYNWGPYYGNQLIELTDTVYAVTAEHEDDLDRSNWIGKSWFLGAIRFALTGVKPESCPNEDGWISWGEKSGFVALVLDDGTKIARTRKLGSSTQLEVTFPGGNVAKQDHAQRELYQLIGMDHEDLMATSFVEQRQIARLILADPAERTRIVNGWMELDPLLKAEAWLKTRLLTLLADDRKCVIPDMPAGLDMESLTVLSGELITQIHELKQERDTLVGKAATLTTWAEHARLAKLFAPLQAQGKQAKAELDAIEIPSFELLTKARDEAALEKGEWRTAYEGLREMQTGQWDGVCPKTCDTCPVADQVKARMSGMAIAADADQAEYRLDEADAKFREADEAVKEAHRLRARSEALTVRLTQLRAQGERLLESVEFIDDHGEPPSDVEAQELIAQAGAKIRELEMEQVKVGVDINLIRSIEKQRKELGARRAEIERDIVLHREAIAIVGRQGAQKEIAEAVLAEIEAGANVLLQGAGIDLEIEVSWSREGRGLATHCDACGTTFPKSTAAKDCAVCGAQRGPKLVEKLIIQPNDRSGAADDIAGLSFQLAASFWLRAKRSAPWAVACIDEPFGQLDKANSRALSAHMHTLIRGSYAFEQGFLVAHDASIMEALPARVQIRGSERGSTLEVI